MAFQHSHHGTLLKFTCAVFIGIPLMEELISIYCQRRGISSDLPNWNFFLALSFFKLAGIAQVIVLSKHFPLFTNIWLTMSSGLQAFLFFLLGHFAFQNDSCQIWVSKSRTDRKSLPGRKIWQKCYDFLINLQEGGWEPNNGKVRRSPGRAVPRTSGEKELRPFSVGDWEAESWGRAPGAWHSP